MCRIVKFFATLVIALKLCDSKNLEVKLTIPLQYVTETYVEVKSSNERNNTLCTRPGCVHAASQILKNMDPKIDPCKSFYDFACGSFLKNARIADDETEVGNINALNAKMIEEIREILEATPAKDELRPIALTKTLYQACMNKASIADQGKRPLLDQLQQAGGWPVLVGKAWNESSFSWLDSIYRLQKAGKDADYFFDYYIAPDPKNSTRRMIHVTQPSLDAMRQELVRGLNHRVVQAYYKYMVDVAVILGADRAIASKQLHESLQFEIMLAKITLPPVMLLDPVTLYNPMSIAELTQKIPSIPWLEYFNNLMVPHAEVTPNEIVNVVTPQFLENLQVLLEASSKTTLANFIMWHNVKGSIPYLTDDLRNRRLVFKAAFEGNTQQRIRWKWCSEIVNDKFPAIVGAMYTRKIFHKSWKSSVQEMVDLVRRQFRQTLTELDWIDEKTRASALAKSDTMVSVVAFPNEILDDYKLNEIHPNLEISSNDLLGSLRNITFSQRAFWYKRLHEPVNKTDWRSYDKLAWVNAQYRWNPNAIFLPAGMLRAPFFDADSPAYLNFGGIGIFIGHEIVHAFDTNGRKYDSEGNLNDWWQNSTALKYLEKSQCIIDQYSKFEVEQIGLKVDGRLTAGENIADNGGYTKSYYAYKDWVTKHGKEAGLPGLEQYSNEQLFWIGIASASCIKLRDESAKRWLAYDPHSPSRFRIDGSLSNMVEFAHDFQCPLGTPMNPVQKCKVW